MMQEEVADRIVSPPGSKVYGSFSCYAQFYTEPEKLLRIKKNSFHPRPQVDSCLLKLKVLSSPRVRVKDAEFMFRVIRKAFSQRRKKAVNPLSDKTFLPLTRKQWEDVFKTCGIDPSSRAEDIALKDFAALADEVLVCRGTPSG